MRITDGQAPEEIKLTLSGLQRKSVGPNLCLLLISCYSRDL